MEIRTEDGNQLLRFTKTSEFYHNEGLFLEFEVILSQQYWNRKELLISGPKGLVNDREINFKQLIISNEKWNQFILLIKKWIDSQKLFELVLSDTNYQQIEVRLIVSDDLISSKEKPALEFSIRDAKLNLRWIGIVNTSSFILFD